MDFDRLQTIGESADPIVWVVLGAIVAGILLLGLVIGWGIARWRRTRAYKQRFGPEYDRVRSESGSTARAEAELERRRARVEQFDVRSLTPEEHDRFSREWRRIQTDFVDNPSDATADADKLVVQLMETRGYPMGDFEQRAEDLSVEHPRVVQNYRSARDIADRNRRGESDTEELRQAFVNYRSLFDDLLESEPEPAGEKRRTVEAT